MWLGGHLERIAGIKKIKHFNVIRVKINNIHLNPPLFFQPMSLYGEDISHWGKYKIYDDGKWCSEWQSLSQDTKMFSLSIQPYHAVSRYLQCQFTSSILCALISLSLSLSLSLSVKRREGRTMFHGRVDKNCKWKKRFLDNNRKDVVLCLIFFVSDGSHYINI